MISFLNAALFAGFVAVAVPPIVHLLSRKRYDEVDWAAMQFLQVSPKTRRKVAFEQLWLMLLRMALLALVVLALTAPSVSSAWLNRWLGATRAGERDWVLLIDGSASMSYEQAGRTAVDAAIAWADEWLARLAPGDRVAVFQARSAAVPLLPTLSADHDQARNALQLLAPARGTVDWPACVQAAFQLLERARPQRDVVILTDGQRYGWADEATLAKWEFLAGMGPGQPRVWLVNVAPERPSDPLNMSLDAIRSVRGVVAAGREVKFKSAVRYSGRGERRPPGPVTLEVDGRTVSEVTPTGTPADGVMPLEFQHKFTAGTHLVTLRMEPDALPTDNRQDFAIEVLPSIPVLIIDGDPRGSDPSQRSRRADFLRDALAPAKDPTPAFLVRVATVAEFTPSLLDADVKGPNTLPRVVVLANLPSLSKAQNEAVEKFLANGGSVFVLMGDRGDAAVWNRISYRAGQGWLPARLVEIVGDDSPQAKLDQAPRWQSAGFSHPAMEIFQTPLPGGLQTAYFPKRWKLDPEAGINGSTGTAIATLTTGEPWLVERGFGRGRCLLTAVPLDNSWRTNFHTLPDYVRFAHEMLYYLAGGKAAELNLAPGQPIVYDPRTNEPPGTLTLTPPDGPSKVLQPKGWPLVYDRTRDPGAYRLVTAGGRVTYYTVQPDPHESVLTPASAEDFKKVESLVRTLRGVTSPDEMTATDAAAGPPSREIWWLPMLIAIGVLLLEIMYTRRLAHRGQPIESASLAG